MYKQISYFSMICNISFFIVSKYVSKVSIYIAHSQKISNALSTSRRYFAKKCLRLTLKNVETQCWIAKTVWQRIPGRRRRARNSKTPTTKTVQTITRNDQLPLTGRPQMLTTSNVDRWCAAVHQVQRSRSMKTSIHQCGELKLYSVSDVGPVELVMQ